MPPPAPNEETFHKARSKALDAFACAEARVIGALRAAGSPIKAGPFSSKLKALKALPGFSTKGRQIDDLNAIMAVRNDLAHSSLLPVDLDGKRFACFRNASEAGLPMQKSRLITYAALQALPKEVSAIIDELGLK